MPYFIVKLYNKCRYLLHNFVRWCENAIKVRWWILISVCALIIFGYNGEKNIKICQQKLNILQKNNSGPEGGGGFSITVYIIHYETGRRIKQMQDWKMTDKIAGLAKQ